MFGKNKNTSTNSTYSKTSSTSQNNINCIVAGSKIIGEIFTDNDFRIDGEVDGTINCQGKLIIGALGKISGEVICNQAVIEGNLNGKLTVKDILTVKETAYIEGEVFTGQLNVEPGGIINGNCTMGNNKVKNINDFEDHNIANAGS